VLARYRDPRLRIIRLTENVGPDEGKNVGLEAAQGDFLTFLDADDRWRPGKLQRELAIMESEPDIGLVFGNTVFFNEAGYLPENEFNPAHELRVAPSVPTKCGIGRRLIGNCFETLISLSDCPCWLQGMMVRRSLVKDVTFPADRRRCPDRYYNLRMWLRVNAAYIDEPTADQRRHGENYTSGHMRFYTDYPETLAEFDSEAQLTDGQRVALHRHLGRMLLGLSRTYLTDKRLIPSLKFVVGAVRYPTSRLKALQYLVAFPLLCAKLWGKPDV
jgi:glycosyltransferase involved in cell wall biosynthesis